MKLERNEEMRSQSIFKRTELKYLLSASQAAALKRAIGPYMRLDEHGNTTISNVYYDTPDQRLARSSLQKPIYKEKLRMRSYCVASSEDMVFVELKKKFDGIVYKRRVSMSKDQGEQYLMGLCPAPEPCQITREIDYFLSCFPAIRPAMFISYDREAYFGKADEGLRITFDANILFRDYDISLDKAPGGTRLLESGQVLMEIKASDAMPLWLAHILSANSIRRIAFSKYGYACLAKDKRETIRKYA